MTDQPCLEVPFDEIEKWEKIQGSCARLYAAAEWGYKQALATPPPAPPSEEDLLRLWQFNFGKTPKDRFMDIAHFVLALAATPPPEPQEAMIPDQYKGHQLHVYRAGFHAGYKHGLTRAPAALTQPAPPTDEELLTMRSWSSHSHTFDSDLVDFARAVLERWGHG